MPGRDWLKHQAAKSPLQGPGLRILFTTPFYLPERKFGGPPQKIHALAKGLVACGHSVVVLTFDSCQRFSPARRLLDGVTVQNLRWLGGGLKQLPIDRSVIRGALEAADLVHAFGIYNFISPITARCARQRGVPFVLEPLGMYPPRARNGFAKSVYNRLLTKPMVADAAAVVAASENEASDLSAIVEQGKVFYRRNGVDLDAFQSLSNGGHLRAKWGIASGEKVVLFVGRLSPIKNLEQLVEAFERANVKGAKLVLVGPGEPAYEARLRALVFERRLQDRIVFAGALYDDDQKAALGLANLFVLPSLNESFGNAAAEAVAAGVPVLLTETCGIAPLIHERAGYAVPLGVESIADGLRKTLDPEFRDQMTTRCEEVKGELSWDEPIRQTIELYERIVRENSEQLTA